MPVNIITMRIGYAETLVSEAAARLPAPDSGMEDFEKSTMFSNNAFEL